MEDYTRSIENYAHLLFRQGQVDSAFHYQEILRKGYHLNTLGLKDYAIYAEKVKGPSFAKAFIETQLLEGIYSVSLLNQLEAIYTKLQLPENSFEEVKQHYMIAIRNKKKQEVKSNFGSTKAPDFALKNLDGKTVSLSSLAGKTIVLDFWATWCGPCKAMFPSMQQLMDQYKSAEDVTFLFIDVLERKDEEIMRDNAQQLIDKNGFTFNVLLDSKDELVAKYKIGGLPTKFVIDKKGNIAFIGKNQPFEDLVFEVEAARIDALE
ncbi:MAG: TlpA disulfide reductase family protein [Saprospiraceae bacterium]